MIIYLFENKKTKKVAFFHLPPHPITNMNYDSLPENQRDQLRPYLDPGNPLAVGSRLPKRLSAVLFSLLTSDPELITLVSDEDGLLKYLNQIKSYQPSVTDHRIRLLFWQDFEHSITENRQMNPCNFHSLVCTEVAFEKLFLRQPHRAAFLLCRPIAYDVAIREGLMHGMKRMREILDLPAVDGKGKINTKILELKLKVTAMMDMRLNGAPKQSIQQLNVHMDATKKGVGEQVRTCEGVPQAEAAVST